MTILQNIKILDFSRLLPGPLATQMLQQMGATVIKVEHPDRTDLARTQPPFVGGESTLFRMLNHGKEILTIDYTSPGGWEELMPYVETADVVIEQFRPGVMRAWGLGYEQLKDVNPRLIYLSLSGYGQESPYAQLAGHDLNYLAYSGILSLTRDANGHPVIPGVQMADIAGGSYQLVMACLAALFHRERTGQGSYLDVAMLDGVMPLLTVPASQQWGGMDPYSLNFLSGALVNYNVYQCADKKWVALGALELKFWNNFCDMVEKPEWVRSNHFELSVYSFPKAEVEALFRSKTQAEWIALAEGRDVCLSPVRTLDEVVRDEHQQHRQNLVSVYQEEKEQVFTFNVPFKIKH